MSNILVPGPAAAARASLAAPRGAVAAPAPNAAPRRLLVIGASRGTGALAAQRALDLGHAVTAFARSAPTAPPRPGLRTLQGDFHDARAVREAVRGQDAVIVTASAASVRAFRENPSYFSEGTALVLTAMRDAGVRRIVVLSALGVGDSRPLLPAWARLVIADLVLRLPYADHARQEREVVASGLDWVVARPSRFTDGPARGYVAGTGDDRVPSTISRADAAAFLVDAAVGNAWVGRAVQLGGR